MEQIRSVGHGYASACLPAGRPDRRWAGRLSACFVFSTIHNVQARVPVKNLVALFSELDRGRQYPLSAS